MPATIADIFWDYFDVIEKKTLDAWCTSVAPGLNTRPGPYGCIEGKNGPISRCCSGYGEHHFLLDWAKRHNHGGTVAWLFAALAHYPDAFAKIMISEGHPPGEYVDIPHGKDDDSDILRHANPSGIFRVACDPWIHKQPYGSSTFGEELEKLGVLKKLHTTARDYSAWLFGVDWMDERNWHIRHHYPIQTAVWLYRLTGQRELIHGACWLLKAFWDNQVYPRLVPGKGRMFYAYDTGRPSDVPKPHLAWGSSQLTSWPWYDSLICSSLFDLYLAAPTPSWARDLCAKIVSHKTDWYLFRDQCPSADLEVAGDKGYINSPLQGGLVGSEPSPWFRDLSTSLIDEDFDDLDDEEPYWPYIFQTYVVSDGRHFDAKIDGAVRYYHSRRYAGGSGKSGILGPLIENSSPAKAIVDALAIRAAIEWQANRDLAEKAILRAKRILIDQFGFMNQLGVKTYRKRDILGLFREAPYGILNTAAGNNRMVYWTGNAYRILRALEEDGFYKPESDRRSL